jgi:hypothetical protein
MNLIPLDASALCVGSPVAMPLRDAGGRLLLARGAVIKTEAAREQLLSRGVYVDAVEAAAFAPALAGQPSHLQQQNVLLDELTHAFPGAMDEAWSSKPSNPLHVWPDLVLRASMLLSEPPQIDFLSRLMQLQEEVLEQIERDADASLVVLVQNVIADSRNYSAKHSLLVAVVCELAARHVAHWPEGCRLSLRCAAITMNIGMTALQDRLATQQVTLSPEQRGQISSHARRGVDVLTAAGVTDSLWLDAVALHHDTQSGELTTMNPSTQLARMLQRADIFTARLSPREGRKALSATAAAQSAYLDEKEQADDAGTAIIKATGLYPPGTLVRLGNGEVALVLRRGLRANAPQVVSVVSRDGLPLQEPKVRDTGAAPLNVTSSVAPHEVKVAIDLEAVLGLT